MKVTKENSNKVTPVLSQVISQCIPLVGAIGTKHEYGAAARCYVCVYSYPSHCSFKLDLKQPTGFWLKRSQKTTSHIRLLSVVLWVGHLSQVSLLFETWPETTHRILTNISTPKILQCNLQWEIITMWVTSDGRPLCSDMALHFYTFLPLMKDHLSYKTTFCGPVWCSLITGFTV